MALNDAGEVTDVFQFKGVKNEIKKITEYID